MTHSGPGQYVPGLGRFIETDPVEGGSANDYDYVSGDSVNKRDTDGRQEVGYCKTTANLPVILQSGNIVASGSVSCSPNTAILDLEVCIQGRPNSAAGWTDLTCTNNFDWNNDHFVYGTATTYGENGWVYRTWVRSTKLFEGQKYTKTKTHGITVYYDPRRPR